LGDTIKNIRNVVELAADIAKENGYFILFFDEIDAIGSERSNVHEVGEIKRAVISFLQVIDRVNYEGVPLAIFGATNHQHQLDSAIWRRFTFHLQFDFPDYHLRRRIIEMFVRKIEKTKIGVDAKKILDNLAEENKQIDIISNELKNKLGYSVSEFEDNILWAEINKSGKVDGLLKLTYGYSGSDIVRGTRVAIFKAIHTRVMTYDILYNSMKLVGGTAIHVNQQDILSTSRNSNIIKEKNTFGPPEI